MAFVLSSNPTFFTFTRVQPTLRPFRPGKWQCLSIPGPLQCNAAEHPSSQTAEIVRRTGNYPPSDWDNDFVQSLASDYVGETHTRQLEKLKRDVKMMLGQVRTPLHQLELIGNLLRLGIHYHFREEIKGIMHSMYNNYNRNDKWKNGNVYATALEFRLLRQHGYQVPQDVLSIFMNEMRSSKPWPYEDMKGILCLYEASYLSIQGENILEEAKDFTRKILEEYLEQNKVDQNDLTVLIKHALELPLHWRMPRLEARWFIDVYERSPGMNPILVELAKLDFNMVQATYQEKLKKVSMWWRSTRIPKKLSFARDRLLETFLWSVGTAFVPQFGYCREIFTKVLMLTATIDDIYDVYGTLDELELFTDAVDRWDINTIEQLPEYMKIGFLALYNFTNGMAYDVLTEQGFHITSYLRKAWGDICKSYLQEMKWYLQGYIPFLEQYMENALVSVSGPLWLLCAYLSITNPIRKEALEWFDQGSCHNIIRCPSLIFRLADDLGTSSKELERGDVAKCVQCYMHESGASEDEARKYMRLLIDEAWKKMNEDGNGESPFSQDFIGIAKDLARMAQCVYLYGDGYGGLDAYSQSQTKNQITTLLIRPISLTSQMLK